MDAVAPGLWQRLRRPAAAVLLAGALGTGPGAASASGTRGSSMGENNGAHAGRLGVVQGVRLSAAAPVSRTIPLARQLLGSRALVLEIGDITFPAVPSVAYEVYVDLPAGAPPDPHGAHHAGTLTFYGLDGRHAAANAAGQMFDITRIARASGSDPASITVTLVPFDLVTAPGGAARSANVVIGRMEVRAISEPRR